MILYTVHVVSKDKYYELKSQGMCVKCGQPRGDSPSEVRCGDCHYKFLEQKRAKQDERVSASLCVQCGVNSLIGNSKYCNDCRTKNNDVRSKLKNNSLQINIQNQRCRVCDKDIDTLGVICQVCLDRVVFTKYDALQRYGAKCNNCDIDNTEKLRFVSLDLSKKLVNHGPSLYKQICFSTVAPKEIGVLCDTCYRDIVLQHLRNLRNMYIAEYDAGVVNITEFEFNSEDSETSVNLDESIEEMDKEINE